MRIYGVLWLFLLVVTSLPVTAQQLQVQASLDRNSINSDESVTLTVTINDSVAANSLDTRPLLKDFIVGTSQVRQSTQILTSGRQTYTQFVTTLFPRREGRINIPPLELAGIQTNPITLNVHKPDPNAVQSIFLTNKVDTETVYVQQQVKLISQLYMSVDSRIQRASIQAPKVQGAEISQVGKAREFTATRNGQEYNVVEYTYAVTPQNSGKLTIQGPTFSADVFDPNGGGRGLFRATKRINKTAPSVSLSVAPIPAGSTDNWLPSEFVSLTEQWSQDISKMRVGEPITRTIYLTAIGVAEQQLVEPETIYPPEIKTYPEQSQTTSGLKDNNLVSQLKYTETLIPSKAGLVVLPPIEVVWFNTLTQEYESTTIAGQSVEIKPALQQTPSMPVVAEPPVIAAPQADEVIPVSQKWYQNPLVLYLCIAMLLLMWLLTLALYLHQRRARMLAIAVEQQPANDKQTTGKSRRINSERIHTALLKNDADKVIALLPDYLATLCHQPQQSLAKSLEQLNCPELNYEVNKLLAMRYTPAANSEWDADGLKKILQQLASQQGTKQKPSPLPSLYPKN